MTNDGTSNLAGFAAYHGLLDATLAETAIIEAKKLDIALVSYLVQRHLLKSETVIYLCQQHSSLPTWDLQTTPPYPFNPPLLSPEFIRRYHVAPLALVQGTLQLGISDSFNQYSTEVVAFHTGFNVQAHLVNEDDLTRWINRYYTEITPIFTLSSQQTKTETLTPIVEQNPEHEETFIQFMQHLLENAWQQRASDIHIEPFAEYYRIRYRIDGLLSEAAHIPLDLAHRLQSRLKILACIDIAERRLPQDGRLKFQLRHKDQVDLRISTCPTLWGEKMVLRFLDSRKVALEINQLGFAPTQQALFIHGICQPQGMILVTGPTGSGKTITLYSALAYLNTIDKNISTIEDPIEVELAGINQINIHPKIGLSFANILRALLRQDPDIIMIGEIRDLETAEIALQAAQTGHLVFATLHTQCARSALTRLQQMGIAAHYLINAIHLIIAQRLVRKLCQHCKIQVAVNHYEAKGCRYCQLGYQGRTAIYEVLALTETIHQQYTAHTDHPISALPSTAAEHLTLYEAGCIKVGQGITSETELLRVINRPYSIK